MLIHERFVAKKDTAGLRPPPSHLLHSRVNHSLDSYVGLGLPLLQDVSALTPGAIFSWLPTVEDDDLAFFYLYPIPSHIQALFLCYLLSII